MTTASYLKDPAADGRRATLYRDDGVTPLAAALFVLGLGDPFRRLGHATAWSIGYVLLSLAFAVTAAIGAVVVARAPIAAQNRWAAWHSRLVAAAAVLVSDYLAFFGLIGLRTWV